MYANTIMPPNITIRRSTYKKDFEEIKPNPDKTDKDPMYLKRPRKLDQNLFKPHNKNLSMPDHLKDRYSKNNKKK